MSQSLARARELVTQLDFPAAQQLLRTELEQANQDPAQADADEAETAALYAAVLLQLSEPHTARTWAAYAYAAMRRLHGERDRRTLHALGVLAVSEHRSGALDRATRSYQLLITALSAVDGPEADRTLAARADATFVEHARGMCAGARTQLAEIMSLHAAIHGTAHPVGIRMTIRLAGMWRDCGDFDRAHQMLTHARAQAAVIPPDEEIHQLISAASRAPADRTHHCGVETADPALDGQPGVYPVLIVPDPVVPEPQDFIPASRSPAYTPDVTEWPDDEILDAPPPLTAPSGSFSGSFSASASVTAPAFRQSPSYLPPPPPPDEPAPPPLVFTAPRNIPAPLTVPRPPMRPPQKPRRGGTLAVVAGAALAAASVALVAVAIVLGGGDEPQAAPPPPTSAAPSLPVAIPSGPVANLKLTDQGDRLLITWVYPATASGPIIVSAAKAGEPMRALQSLPAGTESLTLPGLDPARDYCVTVTVAYSAEHMVMASPVCTDRKKPSPTPAT